jgi:Do/DeqQ family serine protease
MGKPWVWLLQAVLAGVVMFVLAATIVPDSLPWRARTVVIGGDAIPTALERRDGLVSYSAGALRASPSVVSIYAAKAPPRRLPGMPSPFADPGEDPGGGGGLGSGVVMSVDGYVLTNNHVVEGSGTVAVAFGEGKPAPARIVGTDPETDLAVLKVEARDLTPITLGDSDALRIGDVVLAIGNPFGVGQTTTQGIVSGTGRNRVGINIFENFIQTDAAINPGNSGGALVDAAGRLVGINTAILSPSGGSLGIGFAIPVRTATEVLGQIIKEGRVARGWIGVEAQDLTPEIAQALGTRVQAGSVLVRLLRGGPADRAGLRPGDVVAALDGKPVSDTRDLIERTAAIKPGGQGKLTVLRGQTKLEVQLEVGRRPPLVSQGSRR